MTEIHEDYGPNYPYSDHKRGDHISYRLEGHTERGEILWVAAGGKLPNGQDMPPHYVVAPDRGGFPDMVLFSDVVMDAEPVVYASQYITLLLLLNLPRKPSFSQNVSQQTLPLGQA